jgi:uncharacterized protein (DUF1330 family)
MPRRRPRPHPADADAASTADAPPAYAIIDVDVRDADGFDEYVAGHAATVEQYGGTLLVAGGRQEIIEGEWIPRRLVIHRWPSAEAFKRWYDSEEYRPWKVLRQRVATASVVLVEGDEDD